MGAAILLMSLNTSTKCLLSALPIPLQVRKEDAASASPLQVQAAPGHAAGLPVDGMAAERAPTLRFNSTAQATAGCLPPSHPSRDQRH